MSLTGKNILHKLFYGVMRQIAIRAYSHALGDTAEAVGVQRYN